MFKHCALWGLMLALVFNAGFAFAEEAKEEEAAQNEDLEKFHELFKKHNQSRAVGEVAEYSVTANMGGMEITGKAVAEIKEIKEDGCMVITWTQTMNMMGQEQTNSAEVTVPSDDSIAPNSTFEFSTGDVQANGTTYKNCDIVTVTSEMEGPAGPMELVITMYLATDEKDAGMVKMEQQFGAQGTYTTELTKPYAKPE